MTKSDASARLTLEHSLSCLPSTRQDLAVLLRRLNMVTRIPKGGQVLDIGCAAGVAVAALTELGYRAAGVEPRALALSAARALGDHLGRPLQTTLGRAESLPYPDLTFDVVLATAVMEHVEDVGRAFHEIFRVLRPGGVFWFYTTSALCPRQPEVRKLPLYSWYPDAMKRAVMAWVMANRPDLVGYTQTPAVNWFTPAKTRRLLALAGFGHVLDRWDLWYLLPPERPVFARWLLPLLHSSTPLKYLADVCVPCCSYAALK